MRAYLLAVLMVTLSLAGCINDQGSNLGGIGDTTQDELALPDWQVGDQWLYTFITPEFRLACQRFHDHAGICEY